MSRPSTRSARRTPAPVRAAAFARPDQLVGADGDPRRSQRRCERIASRPTTATSGGTIKLAAAVVGDERGDRHHEGEGDADGDEVTDGEDLHQPATLEGPLGQHLRVRVRRQVSSPPPRVPPMSPASAVGRLGPSENESDQPVNVIRRLAGSGGHRTDPGAAGSSAERRARTRSMQVDPSWLSPTWFIDSDDDAVADFADEAAGDATDPIEVAVRLFYAVRDGFRYDPYNVAYDRGAVPRQLGRGLVVELVRAEVGAADGGGPASRDPRPPRLRRRPQPPDEREAERPDGHGPVRLARLQRAAARRPLVQAEHGVQHRAVRAIRHQAARLRRHRRRADASVRPGRQPPHGVRQPARQLRRPAAGADPRRLRRDLRLRHPTATDVPHSAADAGDDAFAS